MSFSIGDVVRLKDEREGIIRFHGSLLKKDDIQLGIELTEGLGDNNGTINGKTYFSCHPQKGIFIKPSLISRQIVCFLPSPRPHPTQNGLLPTTQKTTNLEAYLLKKLRQFQDVLSKKEKELSSLRDILQRNGINTTAIQEIKTDEEGTLLLLPPFLAFPLSPS